MDIELKISSSISPLTSIGSCLVLSVLYISSLYIWSMEHNRDHPSTVKKRFCSVSVVMIIAIIFTYVFSSKAVLEKFSLLEIMGFRKEGILLAILVPICLTSILYLGPLCVKIVNGQWRTCLSNYKKLSFWSENFNDILWWRNNVIAPLSEEITFRSCMLPLLLQSLSPFPCIFINPLFFGLAHFHHINDRLKMGMVLSHAIQISCFQFTYTTLFGIYAAYLFTKTGHFITPFLAHALCNHIGFPDIPELFQETGIKKIILTFIYIVGFISWILLMPICTNPVWFDNKLYWNS